MAIRRVLILSGAIASGKSAVADALSANFKFARISTSAYLMEYGIEVSVTRTRLQELGDQLDRETDFKWVVDRVAGPALEASGEKGSWMLDSARKSQQLTHLRDRFGEAIRHVHLRAPDNILQDRYNLRFESKATPYHFARDHPNEIAARQLEQLADVVFDTSRLSTKIISSTISSLWER